MGTLRLLSFRAGGRRLALSLDEVQAVLPLPLLAEPAGAPGFVAGFFDYRGAPTAALRLDRLLELPEGELGLYSPLILLATEAPAVALHVTRADGVILTDAVAVQPIGEGETFNGCIGGRLDTDGATTYLLRAPHILLTAERARLAALAGMHERRLASLEEGGRAA